MPQYGISVSVAPTVEPVSLAEMKDHLRVSITDEDTMIESMITAAREYLVSTLNRSMVNTSWLLTLDNFPGTIYLPRSKASSITSIKYDDSNATEQTLAASNYRLDTSSYQSRITETVGGSWPVTYEQTGAVRVIYVAGDGAAAADVPGPLKHALKLLCSDMYELREPQVLGVSVAESRTFKNLVYPYRIHTEY